MKSMGYKIAGMLLLLYVTSAAYIKMFPMNFYNYEFPMWKFQIEQLDDPNISPDVIILGDSRPMAGVIPAVISDKCISLCLTGGSAVESYYVLKKFLTRHKPPETVFISMTPENTRLTNKTFWQRTVKYDFLNMAAAMDVIHKSIELNDMTMNEDGSQHPLWLNYIKLYLMKAKLLYYYKGDLKANLLVMGLKRNKSVYEQIKKNKGNIHFGKGKDTVKSAIETTKTRFKPSETTGYYYNELIRLCHDNGIKIIISIAPYNKTSYYNIKKQYLADYTDFLLRLPVNGNDIIDDIIFYYDDDLFEDASHLNEDGARKYSNYVKMKYFR